MNSELLYYVKFDNNCDIEGRIFYEGEKYPVYKKDEKCVVLCSENGDFCFAKELMEKAVHEWNLEVVRKDCAV